MLPKALTNFPESALLSKKRLTNKDALTTSSLKFQSGTYQGDFVLQLGCCTCLFRSAAPGQ